VMPRLSLMWFVRHPNRTLLYCRYDDASYIGITWLEEDAALARSGWEGFFAALSNVVSKSDEFWREAHAG